MRCKLRTQTHKHTHAKTGQIRAVGSSADVAQNSDSDMHVLVCVHKCAELARIHLLCAFLLGRRYAESAALTGGDVKSARDQLMQLLKVN